MFDRRTCLCCAGPTSSTSALTSSAYCRHWRSCQRSVWLVARHTPSTCLAQLSQSSSSRLYQSPRLIYEELRTLSKTIKHWKRSVKSFRAFVFRFFHLVFTFYFTLCQVTLSVCGSQPSCPICYLVLCDPDYKLLKTCNSLLIVIYINLYFIFLYILYF